LFDVLPDPAVALPAQTPRTRPLPTPQRRRCLLAVDGNSLTHRAFHAYHGSHDGGAIYGFLALLAAVCDVTFPDAIVVGFDCRSTSHRRDRYPAYKANRLEKDADLDEALDAVPTLLIELGVNVIVARGWEADDVVGSAATAAEAAGWRCVVATSDRDAFALISHDTTVLRLRSGMENSVLVDAERLRREAGVEPRQYVEFSALRGDTSDNLPGITGIGPAKAAALLRAFPTVADAVADPIGCRSVLGKPLGQTLIDDLAHDQSVFRRNVDLMTAHRDVPVDIEACRPRISPDRASASLRTWGVRGIDGRVALALAMRPDLPPLPEGVSV
jgi:DNA polymerase-1